MNKIRLLLVTLGLAVLAILLLVLGANGEKGWSKQELATLEGLTLDALPQLPPDPSNGFADDPAAVSLGHRLFFDERLSGNGRVACATCHLPGRGFTDGLPLSEGIGTTARKSMTITGSAYSSWLLWDGRADSQWSQALGPLEDPVEHGADRTMLAHLIGDRYRTEYEALFGPLPDLDHLPASAGPVESEQARAAWEEMSPEDRSAVTRVFVNIGKAIAAYERTIQPGPSRFDRYMEALEAGDEAAASERLDEDEIAGLRLFIGKAGCVDCHNGPLFTNHAFHNTGVPARPGLPADLGRALGAPKLADDPFNCLGPYSDAEPGECAELRFLKTEGHELEGAFKPPTLRNVAETAPYMHAGQFATLREVLEHYNEAPPAPVGHSELDPLGLGSEELQQLEAFLGSLTGPLATPHELLRPPDPHTRVRPAQDVDSGR